MTTTKHQLFSALLSVFLIISLIAPSVSLAQYSGDAGSPGHGGGVGEGDGGDPSGDDGGESDSDGDGESDSAEAAASEAAAAEVSEAASIAGVDVSVSSVDTKADPNAKGGTSVSVNGVSMSVDDAISAIGDIADAQAQGLGVSYSSNQPGVDVDATLSAHAMGDTGVVGMMSGEFGTASDVAAAESEHAGRQAAVGYAASFNESRFGNTVAPMATANLSQALSQVAQNVDYVVNELVGVTAAQANTNTNTVTVTPKSHVTDDAKAFAEYTEAVAPAKAAAQEAYKSLEAAYATNNEADIEAAEAAMASAAESMKSVAQSYFGVEAVSVSLSGAGATTGSGTTVGAETGVSSSQNSAPTTGTGGKDNDATYSYDSKTAEFIGYQDVSNDTKNELAGAGNTAATVSGRAGANTVTTVNTAKDVVSTFNTQTGDVQSYDYSGNQRSGFTSQPGLNSGGGSNFSPTGTGGYTVTVLGTQPTTPATDLVTGKTTIGSAPGRLQEAAQARGYNLNDPATVLAVGYAYEIDPRTRADILSAYAEASDFSTLSDDVVEEVAALLSAIAGEAARTNRTVAQQIAVPSYLTSVTVNGEAFEALRNEETREALSALADKITDGSLSSARGLDVTVPVAKSNHFYAAYANPGWASSIANPTKVGQYTKTVVGYIPSEINPAGEGAKAAAARTPGLMSPASITANTPAFTLTTKAPSATLVAENLDKLARIGGTTAGQDNETEEPAETEAANNERPNPFGQIGLAHLARLESGVVPTSYALTNNAYTHPNSREGFATNVGFRTGVNTDSMSESLNETLNEIALSAPNIPFSITSGFRSSKHNSKVGGANKSQHMSGNAVDISLKNLTESQQKALVNAVLSNPSVRGFGFYPNSNSIHFDVRSSAKAYWSNDTAVDKNSKRNGVDFDYEVEQGNIPGWMGTAVSSWHQDKYSGISGATQASGQGTISATPASVTTETPADTSAKTTSASASAGVNSRATEGVRSVLARAGVSRENPISKTVAPAVVTVALAVTVPIPARIVAEIISRNPNISKTLERVFKSNNNTPENEDTERSGDVECTNTEEAGSSSSPCPPTEQGAALWMAFQHNPDWVKLFDLLWPADKQNSINNETAGRIPPSTATVTITVNQQTGEVEMAREDMISDLEQYTDLYSYGELLELIEIFEEVPIVFSDEGEILYSNGLYAPLTEDGYPVDENPGQYIYVVRHIDENGQAVETISGTESLPENLLTRAVKQLVENDSTFYLNDIEVVTYRLINPDQKILRDEYYDYVVRLKNGEVRAITVPEYTSVAFMSERFTSIGYQGDVLSLIGIAHETSEEPTSLFKKAVAFAQEYIGGFFDVESPGTTIDQITELPVISSDIRASDISGIFIYPLADVNCPVIEDSSGGFAYNVVVKDRANPDQVTIIADARCGTGDAAALTEETARHLSDKYGISDMTYSTAVDKTTFRFEPIIHSPGVFTANIGETNPNTEPETPTKPEVTEPTSTSTALLPNLTNEIVFEVKVVNTNGTVLSNWSTAESITIPASAQLYFRWTGSAYQQCLPFLNDNGNYSLTVKNRAMTTGNTESEQYNITERTGVYKIECGGQRNNEFGVDYREIEVTVQ